MSEAFTFVQALKAAGQNPTRASIVAAIQNSHWTDGPGLTPYAYSSSDHNGYTGVQMVTVDATGTLKTLGSVETTDDTASGAINTFYRHGVDAAGERDTKRLTSASSH